MSGTFNIDPENGISGFYIGLSSLDDILNERNSSISSASQLSDEFKKYLSLADGGSISGDVSITNNKSIIVENGHIDIANGDISASNGGIYVDVGGINASNGNVNILCGNYI